MGGKGDDDLIWSQESLRVRAMRRRNGSLPAKEWFDGLEERFQGRAAGCFATIENNVRMGRHGNVTDVLEVSKHRLLEVRITRPGSTAPHLRALGLRDGNTLWLATGFIKQANQLTSQEIRLGDTITEEWLELRKKAEGSGKSVSGKQAPAGGQRDNRPKTRKKGRRKTT